MVDDLEKLLALAEGAAVPGENLELNEAERFAVSVGIVTGTARISPWQVWHRYLEWTKHPIPWRIFMTQFKRAFKQRRIEHQRFFDLNSEPFDLTEEAYWQMRQKLREAYAARKKIMEENRRAKALKSTQGQDAGQASPSPVEPLAEGAEGLPRKES